MKTLIDDVTTRFWSQSIVEGYDNHTEAVEAMFTQHPFGNVLAVNADQSVWSWFQT